MKVNKLTLQGYRNIENIEIVPSDGINVVHGDNAQGKTNLLEGIWLFTGCKSFRGTKDTELVGFGQSFARLDMDFNAFGRDQNASIVIEMNRRASLNGVGLQSPARLMGEFLAVVFSPAHLSLVQAGPSERRKFIDTALGQLSRRYARALTEYNKVLLQRNYLLKDIPR
ncbi:MAG: AAA family ATPase, partial [Oscillospiraceae bacterium]|nr:AAA family ATPase [Oscillospiraceae bacterium]